MTAKATCQRPAASRVTRKDLACSTGRDQRNRTHPTFGIRTSPTLRDRRRTSPGLTATIRKPSLRPRRRQVGLRWVLPKKFAMAWWKSFSACCWTMIDPAASHCAGGARLGELTALLGEPRRRRAAALPVGVLFYGQVPHISGMSAVLQQRRLLGGRGLQPVARHTEQPTDPHRQKPGDHHGPTVPRFLPALKDGASTL